MTDTKQAVSGAHGTSEKKGHHLTVYTHGNHTPRTIEVEDGTSILHALMENAIPLQHNCGGVCACSTCHVIIKNGMEHLPEMTDEEEEQLDEAVGLTLNSRLGCQCKIHGDVTVEIPDQAIYLGH
ncbi:MAG: 2Fe-2S iron-sulfur cluster binding domain-containing protein [Chlorobiales bacterium]|jgi:ferredoxin, 2Fe-2S|nr:2Fe-2S iron-sulfur cluster binding domain-containing protein [Chlorobiales bacterium]